MSRVNPTSSTLFVTAFPQQSPALKLMSMPLGNATIIPR